MVGTDVNLVLLWKYGNMVFFIVILLYLIDSGLTFSNGFRFFEDNSNLRYLDCNKDLQKEKLTGNLSHSLINLKIII